MRGTRGNGKHGGFRSLPDDTELENSPARRRILALNSRVVAMMKWVGILTALISFGTALYALIHSAGELRDHKRVFREQLKSGQMQEVSGDFANAWDSFTHAEATVADEGVFSKLLGGLSAEQREVRTAEQDLAMEWLRSSRVPEGVKFSTIADKLVSTL